jgi:pseudaminic acid synthase
VTGAIEIAGKRIGPGAPTYVVAELSANHHDDYDTAIRLVEAAAEAGADAVKVQTYTAESLTLDSDAETFRIEGSLWHGRTLYDLYREAAMPWEWQEGLKRAADRVGVALFASVFDAASVEFLEGLDLPAYKIASFEIVDLPLIEAAARTRKPLILSTGMATLHEIEAAVAAARSGGSTQLALLKCTSAYPAPADEMHLRTIPDLVARFGVPVGLSDHTLDPATAVAAVALGATIVEKHLTLSRAMPGPDSAFSLEPAELEQLVDLIRTAERALGDVRYGPSAHERESLAFRRSLFAVADIDRGDAFTTDNVRSIRPADGLAPRHLPEILGRHAAAAIARGTPLSWDLVS